MEDFAENLFSNFNRNFDFAILEKYVYTVSARKLLLRVEFMILARNLILWFWRENIFCDFDNKFHFYSFGGKFIFVILTRKIFKCN